MMTITIITTNNNDNDNEISFKNVFYIHEIK